MLGAQVGLVARPHAMAPRTPVLGGSGEMFDGQKTRIICLKQLADKPMPQGFAPDRWELVSYVPGMRKAVNASRHRSWRESCLIGQADACNVIAHKHFVHSLQAERAYTTPQ